jgi:hypothetical protein
MYREPLRYRHTPNGMGTAQTEVARHAVRAGETPVVRHAEARRLRLQERDLAVSDAHGVREPGPAAGRYAATSRCGYGKNHEAGAAGKHPCGLGPTVARSLRGRLKWAPTRKETQWISLPFRPILRVG